VDDENEKRRISRKTFEEFDEFLHEKGLSFECVTIGASSLILMDVITRDTKDCDVLYPAIPEEIKQASVEFYRIKKIEKIDLAKDWFNNGPESMRDYLPEGWKENLQTIFDGKALTIKTLDRVNLLRTKLLGLCDRGADLFDCINMKPTEEEIDEATPWVKEYDGNPMWPKHVDIEITKLKNELIKRNSEMKLEHPTPIKREPLECTETGHSFAKSPSEIVDDYWKTRKIAKRPELKPMDELRQTEEFKKCYLARETAESLFNRTRAARNEFEKKNKIKAKLGIGEIRRLRNDESESAKAFDRARDAFDQLINDPEKKAAAEKRAREYNEETRVAGENLEKMRPEYEKVKEILDREKQLQHDLDKSR